ncbi:MAG: LysM repeat protein [bacterium]|jgi:LysM repeat protein
MDGEKLKISDQADNSKSITVQLNPTSIERKQDITYDHGAPIGSLASESRFVRQEPQSLAFKIIFDGTGVLEDTKPVMDQINKLTGVVYTYDGNDHQPNIVEISWGSELFVGRLDKMDRNFTLYQPDGSPLRAELSLSFIEYVSIKEQTKLANKSSPDLTHIVQVQAGDTLPSLCLRIYRDSQYYPVIARINKLTNFRQLKPGSELIFPPIK